MGSTNQMANIGNALAGHIPQGANVPGTVAPMTQIKAAPQMTAPVVPGVTGAVPTTPSVTNGVIPQQATPGYQQPALNVANPSAVPQNAVPTVATPSGGQNNDIYGGLGGNINTLLSSETPGSANNTAQAIINANQPNVAQGSAQLNTGLAAAGISPSSSVSALENSNYQGGVAQQDASEMAQVNLQEQQMQQQLVESLMPSAQQQTTDSSGWSIFGDVMNGLGSAASTAALAGA